ncbi:MAG: exonuclease domain-containing protein [Oscillospiraceae bacterium]|nr:exonuclease domain-containing protein [Oscillospiraceae bacterium]
MQYIIFDLEWNNGNRPIKGSFFDEIIEIGAVRLDERLNPVDTFSRLIKPTANLRLSSLVKRLTHINKDELSNAKHFKPVYADFLKWCGLAETTVVTWSTMDIQVLLKNLVFHKMGDALEFMHHFADVQQFVREKLGLDAGRSPGLSAAAEILGIKCDDMDMHRALDDAIVTAKCLKSAYNEDFLSFIKPADSDFYKRLAFKAKVIFDYDNRLIKKSLMVPSCPCCGLMLKRSSAFTPRSKAFDASFFCGGCDTHFNGRVRVKQEYDGIVYIKKLNEL